MDIWTSLGDLTFFESERLMFRPFLMTDRYELHTIVSDPENLRFIFPAVKTQAETDYLLVHYFMKEPLGIWAIVDKESQELVGAVRFENLQVQNKVAELGYFLKRSYWGQGLMTEAVSRLVDLSFSNLGLSKLVLIVHLENQASRRVAEKSGFRLVKQFKGSDRYTHAMRDYLRFELEG